MENDRDQPHLLFMQDLKLEEIEEDPLECLMFDGKTDETRVRVEDENGRKFQGMRKEEHVTLVGEPGNCYRKAGCSDCVKCHMGLLC